VGPGEGFDRRFPKSQHKVGWTGDLMVNCLAWLVPTRKRMGIRTLAKIETGKKYLR